MFAEFKKQAKEKLAEVIKDIKITLEEPPGDFGDLSAPCFELAPILKKSPNDIAEELASKIKPSGLIKEVKAAGGYINFYLNFEKLAPVLINKIKSAGDDYGRGSEKGKIVLEHTSANPDGPLHIGHGRNAIIGDTLQESCALQGMMWRRSTTSTTWAGSLQLSCGALKRESLTVERKTTTRFLKCI
jgi:arginyl-tRNA synthetase